MNIWLGQARLGALFWGSLHPAGAQNKALISNTVSIYTHFTDTDLNFSSTLKSIWHIYRY